MNQISSERAVDLGNSLLILCIMSVCFPPIPDGLRHFPLMPIPWDYRVSLGQWRTSPLDWPCFTRQASRTTSTNIHHPLQMASLARVANALPLPV